jgi:histidyl-tRNA synthetase
MKKGPTTPKGFRDIVPEQAKVRRETINKIAGVLEKFGFVALETPTLEFAETLLGKYGEEERLIYQFTDRGGRKLALRYDLTVPLARFVANNLGLLKPTFSRYQIGQVFRGENPQKGRYREFTQFDFDVVGSSDPEEDARVIAAALEAAKILGLTTARMAMNDRQNFKGLSLEEIRAIDKIYKVGQEKTPEKLLNFIANSKPTENLKNIFTILKEKYSLKEGVDFFFDPSLARGLDYYTGSIFELKPSADNTNLSVGGGGRYDNLIGIFAGREIPAVGFSFGLDRLVEMI